MAKLPPPSSREWILALRDAGVPIFEAEVGITRTERRKWLRVRKARRHRMIKLCKQANEHILGGWMEYQLTLHKSGAHFVQWVVETGNET